MEMFSSGSSESEEDLPFPRKLDLSFQGLREDFLLNVHSCPDPHLVEILVVNNNQIASVPASLPRFSNLRELDFSNNNLHTLSSCIGKLCRLTRLHLRNNFIDREGIPKAIVSLKKLQVRKLIQQYTNY